MGWIGEEAIELSIPWNVELAFAAGDPTYSIGLRSFT